jgi:hypothetical protein
MRQLISGMVAAVAVMATAPAMACGYNPCYAPQAYVAPVQTYSYSGCNPCGGWGQERLADPEAEYAAPQQYAPQYYYVNQGPTYSGPGDWAPRPVYRERGISGWNGYSRPYYHHRSYHHYRPWYPRTSYYHAPRFHHYGYAPRHAYAPRYAPAPYYGGHRVLRRYY